MHLENTFIQNNYVMNQIHDIGFASVTWYCLS